jgi:hypothetical protein
MGGAAAFFCRDDLATCVPIKRFGGRPVMEDWVQIAVGIAAALALLASAIEGARLWRRWRRWRRSHD